MALLDEIGVALQFSALRVHQQEEALRRLQSAALGDVRDYIQTFRAGTCSGNPGQFSVFASRIPRSPN